MLEGYYTIASGMMAQQRKFDVQGNNLVNSQTPGYHAQRIITTPFSEELAYRFEQNNTGGVGTRAYMTVVNEITTQFQSGDLEPTERDLDIAINGEGYFTLQGADGNRYITRNGSFEVDGEGFLMLPNAGRVLSVDGNPLRVGTSAFSVEENGTVFSAAGRIGQLALTQVPQGTRLTQLQNGLYADPGGAGAAPAGVTFVQRSLESSNVDLNREYTMLMEAQKSFSACSTALKLVDELNQKAASQIASIV